jgi:dCTP deaminase
MLSGKQGILPIQDLRKAITQGTIASPDDPIPQTNLQPASLDLRLGGIAHRLRCSFLPQGRSVSDRLEEIAMDSIYLDQEGTVLEVNRPYLIPLTETLNLPPDIRARANPRSSTGRLDIFTRVITNDGNRFDDIPAGYQGPMYLEIVSRSYTVRVHRGQSLNQIRLIRGNP